MIDCIAARIFIPSEYNDHSVDHYSKQKIARMVQHRMGNLPFEIDAKLKEAKVMIV